MPEMEEYVESLGDPGQFQVRQDFAEGLRRIFADLRDVYSTK